MIDKQQHGGKREGAGRKPRFGVPMIRKSIRIPPDWLDQLEAEYGSIQKAIEVLVAQHLTK